MRVEGVMPTAAPEKTLPVTKQGNVRDDVVKEGPGQDAEEKTYSKEEIVQGVEKANKIIEAYDKRIEFSIHEKTNKIMVKVIRGDEVIREIPPEKILNLVAKMMELAGLLVDEKA